jgi:hypothetical protein
MGRQETIEILFSQQNVRTSLSYSPIKISLHKATNGELSISCRDRHCPKCQTAARERWIAARRRELLPTRYLHVVFTLPRHLAQWCKLGAVHLWMLSGVESGYQEAGNTWSFVGCSSGVRQ